MPRPPKAAPSKRKDLSGEWMPLGEAFRALGLRLEAPTDRRVWTYFVSPGVRLAHTDGGVVELFEGPHTVLDEGDVVPLSAPGFVPVQAGAWLARVDDIAYILDHVPYLFDGVGAVAWKVDSQRLLWRKKAREDRERQKALTLLEVREVLLSELQGSDPKGQRMRRAKATILRAHQVVQGLTPERLLDDHAGLHRASLLNKLSPESAATDMAYILETPELFEVQGVPWELRDRRGKLLATVAPPFVTRRREWAPPRFVGRAWLDSYVQDWKRLEHIARVSRDALMHEIQGREFATMQGVDIPNACGPNFLRRAEGLSAEPGTEEYRPAALAIYESIGHRRAAFLRACKRDELGGKALSQDSCQVCGAPVARSERKTGRPSKFCNKSECNEEALYREGTRLRGNSRDFEVRRNLPTPSDNLSEK